MTRPHDVSVVATVYSNDGSLPTSTTSSRQCLTPDERDGASLTQQCLSARRDWLLPFVARDVYGPQLEKTPFKVSAVTSLTSMASCNVHFYKYTVCEKC